MHEGEAHDLRIRKPIVVKGFGPAIEGREPKNPELALPQIEEPEVASLFGLTLRRGKEPNLPTVPLTRDSVKSALTARVGSLNSKNTEGMSDYDKQMHQHDVLMYSNALRHMDGETTGPFSHPGLTPDRSFRQAMIEMTREAQKIAQEQYDWRAQIFTKGRSPDGSVVAHYGFLNLHKGEERDRNLAQEQRSLDKVNERIDQVVDFIRDDFKMDISDSLGSNAQSAQEPTI